MKQKITEKNFEPTLDEPKSIQAKNFQDKFNKTMVKHNINLKEVDDLLTEKEQSLKKKIFNLSKMESLVFSDPKLSAVYDEMAENGEEKYGYHYNETIMNIIFNEYVLNSAKYLQKYKMAIPKKKKRRDKSGINSLRKRAEEIKQKREELKKEKESQEKEIDETTSAGAAATGSGNVGDYTYVGPAVWGSGDLMKGGKKQKKDKKSFWKGGKIIQESDYLIEPKGFEEYYKYLNEESNNDNVNSNYLKNRNEKIKFILNNMENSFPIDVLNDMPDDFIDTLYHKIKNELEMNGGDENGGVLNEKAKSKAQQKFMGMVYALQKGELKPSDVGPAVKKAAKSMSKKDVEDFASTKHKDLPEKVKNEGELNEDHLTDKDDKISFIIAVDMALNPDKYEYEYAARDYWEKLKNGSDDKLNQVYLDTEKKLKEMGIDPTIIKETMIDNQENSMKMKPPINIQGGSEMPIGLQSTGLMKETKNDDTMEKSKKYLDELNKELKLIEMHQKNLEEDRKPSTLVMKDRLGKENEKNFKQDLKHSGTKKIIDVTKELEWKDEQTDVSSDPQKLGKDIEKEALKNTKGSALKNNGNSTNNSGDEIPKRNLTDEEQNEVDLYRKGLGDYVYDNEPDERYMERMKRDMGEENFKKREKRLKFNADAPLYNKDTQPVENGIDKVQFDKAKSKWNERMGINESTLTGKYVDEMGKTRFFDFNTLTVKEIKDAKDLKKGAFFKMNLNGLGNTLTNKGMLIEGINDIINEWDFYTDGNDVFVHKPVSNLNESEDKKSVSTNEDFNKMKHLFNYNPNKFIDTKRIKL